MTGTSIPPRERLTVCFAHAAYQLAARFAPRNTHLAHFEVRTAGELKQRVPQADVLVISGLWHNELLDAAPRLGFVQCISSGVAEYDQCAFRKRGVGLASDRGVNEVAVAEHAMALILALKRHLHTGRDNQSRRHWRPMIPDIGAREDEVRGKTLL